MYIYIFHIYSTGTIVQERGITFSKVACLARCNGAHVDARRADEPGSDGGDGEATLEAFRKAVLRTCESEAEEENFQVRKKFQKVYTIF